MFFDFGEKKKVSAYDALVDAERSKAREKLIASQAKVRGRELAMKDADAARFAGLSRTERAKERVQKARSFAKSVTGAVGAVGDKLSRAEQRFNQKAGMFGGQNQNVGGNYDGLPAYLRPATQKKAKRGGKTITIRVQ